MLRKITSLCLFIFLFAGYNYAQTGWQRINFDPTFNLTKVIFLNENTGIVVGYKDEISFPYSINCRIFRTTDGGSTWNVAAISDLKITDLNFFNSTSGFYGTNADGLNIIKITSNAGETWLGGIRVSSSDRYQPILSSAIVDNTTAFAVGRNAQIQKTTNSGMDWIPFSSINTSKDILNITFLNSLTGYALDQYSIFGYRTTNGGASWLESVNSYDMKRIWIILM